MDKGKLDRTSPIQVFETKPIRKDFNYKLNAADVFNEFIYVGDDRGTLSLIQATSTPIPSASTIPTSSPSPHKNRPRIYPSSASTNSSAIRLFLLCSL